MEDNALPTAAPAVEAGAPIEAAPIENADAEQKPEAEAEQKPQKTPEQREIERLRRGIDRRTRQLAEARAQAGLTHQQQQAHNRPDAGDSETLSLTRAEAERLIAEEATKRAPTIARQQAQEEQHRAAAASLKKSLGDEFEELTSELADVFTGPRQLDVLQAENPAALIRYLTDPDNADEAEAIAGMSHFQAGRAIAGLEAKLKAAEVKPQASKAPAPLESLKGTGPKSALPSDSDSMDEWIAKERARVAKARTRT